MRIIPIKSGEVRTAIHKPSNELSLPDSANDKIFRKQGNSYTAENGIKQMQGCIGGNDIDDATGTLVIQV